ncbi:MAG: Flp1 family type IVb pilin [Eubacteriales bacterium]|nr:Flp1 family type IVb pilin [Eubacteriales bacterium]MDD3349295.1 Flp1 family type IVb pilin [Eubacteriales bacterium]
MNSKIRREKYGLVGTVHEKMMKNSKKGMEMVQVAILIAIAVALGLIFRERIMDFVDATFDGLSSSGF